MHNAVPQYIPTWISCYLCSMEMEPFVENFIHNMVHLIYLIFLSHNQYLVEEQDHVHVFINIIIKSGHYFPQNFTINRK